MTQNQIFDINHLLIFFGESQEIELIHDLIRSCADYVRIVTEHESTRLLNKKIMVPNEYRQIIEELDHSRRIIHDRLIDNVIIVNRLCSNKGMELVYDGSTSDRAVVGDFAFSIVDNIFSNRSK